MNIRIQQHVAEQKERALFVRSPTLLDEDAGLEQPASGRKQLDVETDKRALQVEDREGGLVRSDGSFEMRCDYRGDLVSARV